MMYRHGKQLFEMKEGQSRWIFRATLGAEDFRSMLETGEIYKHIYKESDCVVDEILDELDLKIDKMLEKYIESKKAIILKYISECIDDYVGDEDIYICDISIVKNGGGHSNSFSVLMDNMVFGEQSVDFEKNNSFELFKEILYIYINNRMQEFIVDFDMIDIVQLEFCRTNLIAVRNVKADAYAQNALDLAFDVSKINSILTWESDIFDGSGNDAMIVECWIKNNELIDSHIIDSHEQINLIGEKEYQVIYEVENGKLIYKEMCLHSSSLPCSSEVEMELAGFNEKYENDITDDMLLHIEEVILEKDMIDNKTDADLNIIIKTGKTFFGANIIDIVKFEKHE